MVGTSFVSRKVSGASCSAFADISGCCLRENGTFRLYSLAKVLGVIQMCVHQSDFMRIVLLTGFLTPIFISAKPGQCSKFCKGSGQSTSTDVLNIVSNNCKYGSCGFCFDFSFHWVFTLNLTRFCGYVFKVFFGHFIQNKVFSLSVFKSFLRIFMFRFIRTFKNFSFEMELSQIGLYD
jgi:hypothetical protein